MENFQADDAISIRVPVEAKSLVKAKSPLKIVNQRPVHDASNINTILCCFLDLHNY